VTGAPGPAQPFDELHLDLPAAHSAVRMARDVVRQFARSNAIRGNELETLVLVASELLGNAVDHGGGRAAMEEGDLEQPVHVLLDLHINGTGWSLEIADEGGGEPDEVAALLHPDGPPDLEDERGRGFYLLAQMVDSLEVRRRVDGRGLILRAERKQTPDGSNGGSGAGGGESAGSDADE